MVAIVDQVPYSQKLNESRSDEILDEIFINMFDTVSVDQVKRGSDIEFLSRPNKRQHTEEQNGYQRHDLIPSNQHPQNSREASHASDLVEHNSWNPL